MSFHLPHIAHRFVLKRQTYERFFFLRRLRPSHSLRISSLHLKDIRGVQGTARHRTDHHQRADAVRALGRRQHNAIQHHQLPYRHGDSGKVSSQCSMCYPMRCMHFHQFAQTLLILLFQP